MTNKKIEAKENARLERNPTARFRYNRFTTFAGFIYFGPMTEKQQRIYDEVKQKKRSKVYKDIEENKALTLIERLYNLLIEGKLSKEGLMQASLVDNRKYSTVLSQLNTLLKDNGKSKTVMDLVRKSRDEDNSKSQNQISNIVPKI